MTSIGCYRLRIKSTRRIIYSFTGILLVVLTHAVCDPIVLLIKTCVSGTCNCFLQYSFFLLNVFCVFKLFGKVVISSDFIAGDSAIVSLID